MWYINQLIIWVSLRIPRTSEWELCRYRLHIIVDLILLGDKNIKTKFSPWAPLTNILIVKAQKPQVICRITTQNIYRHSVLCDNSLDRYLQKKQLVQSLKLIFSLVICWCFFGNGIRLVLFTDILVTRSVHILYIIIDCGLFKLYKGIVFHEDASKFFLVVFN